MFCTSCGTELSGRVDRCPSCGTSQGRASAAAAVQAVTQSGAVKGFFVLFVSFFTMPFKTLRLTLEQLREMGGAGTLGVGTTTVPHLTWLKVAGNTLISLAIIVILAIGLYKGITSLEAVKYDAAKAFGGLIWKPLVALFVAVIADWVIGIALELLGLWAGISNDLRKIATR